ncbi:MAG: hypothetical protein U9Q03_04245 [Patescibacteria group bacterium]|nr:hypothetical protein [Patescibacteria group bacterium]
MQNLQEIHRRLEELKRRRRELNRMFKDELAQNEQYQKIVEDLKVLREKKKSIENAAKVACFSEADELDRIKEQVASEREMMTDVALNMYVEGKTVEIVDEDARYVPQFSVKFKKEKSGYQEEAAVERAESHPDRNFFPEQANEALSPA